MTSPATAPSMGNVLPSREGLIIPQRDPQAQSLRLSRDEPFGITLIIGGTNVRFCVSHHASKEPLTNVVTWAQLKRDLEAERPEGYKKFETAHPFVYPKIVDEFVKFFEKQFDLKKGPLPIENLCAFNISIAGLVNGDERRQPGFLRPVNGIGAEVTTTNTGLRFARTQIGRDLYSAFKARIPGMQLSPDNVFVLNDARAGLEGERILLGIPADKRVFFEIGGTGEGSQYDIPGFDEVGHRIIADSMQRKFLYIAGEKLADFINPDGSFKVLERHQRYAEHIVAGPWTGIRFVKDLEDNAPAMSALAKWILDERKERLKKTKGDSATDKSVTHEELLAQLDGIADLQSGDRHRWAVDSNAPFIKEINGLILNPDLRMVLRYLPCDLQLGPLEARNPERAMRVRAWSRYKLHLKERGQIAGKIYREMNRQGVPPDYFILGGGLGEMFNKYPQEQREDAIREITDAGKLPPGLFNFSQVSPEARESAISHRTVMETHEEWKRLRATQNPVFKMAV